MLVRAVVSILGKYKFFVSRDDSLHILPPIARHIGRVSRAEAGAPETATWLTAVSLTLDPREEFESSH